jgi:hypothetical protein
VGGYCLLKSNGGDSGNRMFVLYWRCPLIRVSVIRGSTVIVLSHFQFLHVETSHLRLPKYFNRETVYLLATAGLIGNFRWFVCPDSISD